MSRRWTPRRSSRGVFAVVAAAAILLPLGWLWWSSLVPDTYSMLQMGYPEYGGGPGGPGHEGHAMGRSGMPAKAVGSGAVSVPQLTGPRAGSPDVDATLVARREQVTPSSGDSFEGYTINHLTPGPVLRARQGDLVQVTLVNESVPDGVTLHWHGLDVPNAEDGVAGVTQDAVPPGQRHTYRFVAEDPGSYWYHSHQTSHEQVRGGLFGALVIEPAAALPEVEVLAAVHTYGQLPTVNGSAGERPVTVAPGAPVRVRVVNTDNAPLDVTALGVPHRVLAVDARDVAQPGLVEGRSVQVPAGGRVDLGFTTPTDGSAVRVQLGADLRTALIVGPADARAPGPSPVPEKLDLLHYGSPADVGFDPAHPARRFEYSIGRRPGFLDGRPGLHWSINGGLYPNVPMFMVSEGDVVRTTLTNSSGEIHPMHLHGHHAVVLSRNGVAASGSPWWVDSLDVASGDTYEIAFLADNPGIWMDHCHNLPHAAEGLVTHLAYAGVSTPYVVGGAAGNKPE